MSETKRQTCFKDLPCIINLKAGYSNVVFLQGLFLHVMGAVKIRSVDKLISRQRHVLEEGGGGRGGRGAGRRIDLATCLSLLLGNIQLHS